MVAIITAELRQYRQFILISYGLVAVVFALPFPKENMNLVLLFAFLAVLLALCEAARLIKKADRLMVQLPVALWRIAITRLLLFVVYATGVFLVAWLSKFAFQRVNIFENDAFNLLSLYGFILFYIATILITNDIRSSFGRRYLYYTLHLLSWIVMWFALDYFLDTYLSHSISSFFGVTKAGSFNHLANDSLNRTFIFICAGCFALFVEQMTFMNRRSYLEHRQ